VSWGNDAVAVKNLVKNKATIERETLISRAIGELNRPLGKDVRKIR
jgi:hypothetical protein